jgi:uncharacterized membrane protein HdeD (DUF308 family)
MHHGNETLCRRANRIIWHSDLLTTRVSIAIGSLVWGLLLLWPGELFVPARTTYRLMAEIASEQAWGVAFLCHGMIAMITLLQNKACRTSYLFDALLGCTLWTTATLACFASHWKAGVYYAPPAAMSAEVSLMLASWWYLARWDWRGLQRHD